MSSKLANKLKREAKKSPGKAAALGSLLLVAMYFWLPLVKGLFGGSEAVPPAPPVAAASDTTPNAATPTTTGATATAEPTYTWKQLAEAIDHDKNMKPAEPRDGRDPFRAVEKPQVEETVSVVPEEPSVQAMEFSPAEVGLALTSTIVGTKRRAARINFKTFGVGDIVTAETETAPIGFEVVAVTDRSATLKRNGKEYELKMARTRTSQPATEEAADDATLFDPSVLFGK